ncbi:MAG: carboxylating nicotinate-nucleotide diphosphorylase [Deltaproteobacteria bacterium]|nr:carboxylating nicotinate-nucleotide diphosphorylase [Deltaproteobacteria bacterium]
MGKFVSLSEAKAKLNRKVSIPYQILIKNALQEDLGKNDITTQALFTKKSPRVSARIIAKQDLVLAGAMIAKKTFKQVDPQLKIRLIKKDGIFCEAGQSILEISGKASSILTAERTALNFLQHLSGVATLTQRFVQAVKGTCAKILDTRKTLPGWRNLQKYAVKVGGGANHRFGLYDAYLIKDNHLALYGSLSQAIEAVRKHRGKKSIKIEVEVDTLQQFEEAIDCGPDIILLDNMSLEDMHLAVLRNHKIPPKNRPKLEASGSVNLNNVRAIAQTGVDFISVGALTHSAQAMDLSLEIKLDREMVFAIKKFS